MKSLLKSIIFFVFIIHSVYAKFEIKNGDSFDYRKAILFATSNSPDFDSITRQLNVSRLEEETANAKLLPSLDLSATHGLKDSSPKVGTSPWNSLLNLSLSETLYDNGVTNTNKQIAILTRKQNEVNLLDKKNSLSLGIISQYLTYSLNVKLLEIQNKQFKFLNKQYDLISKDYYQGIKTQKDYLRFKTQVNRGEIDLINAKNTLLKSKQELERLIGINISSSVEINFLPILFDNIKNQIGDTQIDLENHLQLQYAQIQKEINQLSTSLIERKTLPEWSISTGINYGSSNYLGTGQKFTDNSQLGWNALVSVKYNFFDWGIRSRDKQVAIERDFIQKDNLDSQLLALKSNINQLKINIEQIQRNFDLSKELFTLETTNLELIEREYRNGKIQYLDLVTGLSNYSDAEIRYFTAISDLQNARYTFLYHQGKLYDELIK